MTPHEFATFALGRGPTTVSILASDLIKHGHKPGVAFDEARASLDYLVGQRKAERIEVHGVDLYRLPGSTPIAASQADKV